MIDLRNVAISILATNLDIEIELLKSVLNNPLYKIFKIPKKSGGARTIHAPIADTKKVQDIIYKKFLKKFAYNGLIKDYCIGGIPKKSTYDCFLAHSYQASRFLVDIDLKDAFHCIDKVTLTHVLGDVICREVSIYRTRYERYLNSFAHRNYLLKVLPPDIGVDEVIFKKIYDFRSVEFNHKSKFGAYPEKFPLLFPNKTSRFFRKLLRDHNSVHEVKELCDEMAKILAEILTYKGRLVQGCPTSPILMALVLTYTELIEKLQENFRPWKNFRPGSYPENFTGKSVYVDNITLSDNFHKSKAEVSEKLRHVISDIERNSIWKFNWDKIHVYDLLKEQPLLLGMRLKRNRKTRQELKLMTKERIKGAKRKLNAWEPWYYYKPTLPKEMQRKIRSAVHKACINKDKEVQNIAVGYIVYVFNIYKSLKDIPMQIKKPILHYIENVNSGVLNILHKIRNESSV